jgi:hypothetical protein
LVNEAHRGARARAIAGWSAEVEGVPDGHCFDAAFRERPPCRVVDRDVQ